MNRRDFLKSLLALGAVYSLPALPGIPTALATPSLIDRLNETVIDAIWERGVHLFDVSEWGSISFADFAEPRTREDAYDVYASDLDSPQSLEEFAQRCALHSRLQNLYEEFRYDLETQLEEAATSSLRRQLKSQLAQYPDDPDKGWIAWLELDPERAMAAYADSVETFLSEPPDWNEYEWLPDQANAQGAAYKFFLSEDYDVLDTLGVVIVEGDCPGSSYFAAELRVPVDEANAAAKAADLPYRFQKG